MKKIIFLVALSICIYSFVFAQSKKELFDNGVEFLTLEKYQEAIDRFTMFIKLDLGNAYVYKNRGVAFMKLKKYDLAIQDFEKGKSILPNLKGIHSNLGVAWYCKKEYEKAIENYSVELNRNAKEYYLFFNRALCYAELEKNEKALEDVSKTLELKPDFNLALSFKEVILMRLKRTGENEKHLSELDQESKKAPEKASAKSSAKLALQVGAFQNKEFARKLEKKLALNGYDSRVLILKGAKGMTWHLVRVGSFSNSVETKPLLLSLKEKMSLNAITRPVGAF